ncbi:TRAP transporter small permease subunit [Nodosilinea sp. LEGE 07088]|uniref:TRAP transporter small permease subunit n=1 Tax=Nodosilinea sp. LEGE 07088 TaxID=2777968 RepID=UPI001881904B|nr:TRAP transporter small permease subunit [Nodosilinea sp. LEGE 07088]
MHRLLHLARAIDAVINPLGRLLSWLVLLTIAVGFYNVMARYIGRFVGLQLASNRLIELQWYLFSMTFLLSFPYVLLRGANVRVDFLEADWSAQRKAMVGFWGTTLLLIPFCLLGLWVTVNPVLQSWGLLPDGTWGQWEMSPDANGLPRAPIKSMVLVAFTLLLAQGISQAIKYWAVWCGYLQGAALPGVETELPPVE